MRYFSILSLLLGLSLLVNVSHACPIYAINDKRLNLSQLLCLEPDKAVITPLHEYASADLESAALHPHSGVLYLLSSSDADGFPVGELYSYQPSTGALQAIGNTGYDAIDSLAFCEARLYGWARGTGLVEIDIATATTQLVLAATEDVEGLTCDSDGLLYGVYGTQLISYDGSTVQLSCELPATTETLEVLEQNSLLLGVHDSTQLWQLDLQSCEVVPYLALGNYRDIEGLAVQTPQCVNFEQFTVGAFIEGQDVVYPGLTIATEEGRTRVVYEGQEPPIYSGSQISTVTNQRESVLNGCLGKKGVGIGDFSKKHNYTFTFDQAIKHFSLWMHDYGDYNNPEPTIEPRLSPATMHTITLDGFDATQQLVARQQLRYRYQAPNVTNISGNDQLFDLDDNLIGNPYVKGDACRAESGQLGNRMWSVSGNGMTEVKLHFYNNQSGARASDPHLALSAICFTFDD